MVRLVPAAAAIAASSSLAYGFVSTAHEPMRALGATRAPIIIGNDKPVNLGRMIITATPLP
ncbi:hypothetical protein WBP06_15090 [Novosphingobium sp. BL-8H]|uniref:hypothetical protein n=1 Tax=Novosphingobium sp. BL-8H TaxID=3127640 RepID=UPI003756834F